jgi:alginate O-acetyltransferase complex protein AlgI
MWAMAGALWFALKVFTLVDGPARPWGRTIGYLLAWPGMDAFEFFRGGARVKPPAGDCAFAAVNVATGGALIYVAARIAYPESLLVAGWLGMIGIVLALHFGIFKALALLWRAFGVAATPIMDTPARSRSLSEFWGRRWNTGFSIPARRYLMEPIARRFGTAIGVLAVFLVSGLVHELVISLPAKAGYGLPTLYFLIQGGAIICERIVTPISGSACAPGVPVWRRALPTLVIVGVPAFILFHPPFVYRVIIPFLKAIGAL